jgi:parallel beta-helix repeat protein
LGELKTKKSLISLYVLFLITTTGMIGFFVYEGTFNNGNVSAPKTIIVDSNGQGNYTDIQTAIDNAEDGDTIYVWAGYYNENITVNKGISLIGNGTSNTTINGSGHQDAIKIIADDVNITGFTLLWGYTSVIRLIDVENCKIDNNHCFNNMNVIYLQASSNNSIELNICKGRNGISLINSNFNNITNNNCSRNNYGISLTSSSNNTIMHNNCSITYIGVNLDSSNNNKIFNNTCLNHSSGIKLRKSFYNMLENNNCSNYIKQGWPGIDLDKSSYNLIANNTCANHGWWGIELEQSTNNILFNNTCYFNGWGGINIYRTSDNNKIISNKLTKNGRGIYVDNSNYNKVFNNTCWDGGGIGLISTTINAVINNTCINTSIYLRSSNWNKIIDNKCLNYSGQGISLESSSNNFLENNFCINTSIGIYLTDSSDNIIENCSISLSNSYDFYLRSVSKRNVAIKTSFNTINVRDSEAELIVKNYLHVQVFDPKNLPVSGVDVSLKDNDEIIYATSGFGGTKPKTNVYGQLKWLLVTDRIYYGSNIPMQNKTTVSLKYQNKSFCNSDREVNMATSHFEYFYLRALPSKIILENPSNNSYINDPTPEFKWHEGFDKEGEPLSYFVQIYEFEGNWTSLVGSKHTGIGVLNWSVQTPLSDGDYEWHVCANNGFGNGTWSDFWRFSIDTTPPKSKITIPLDDMYYNSMDTISGTAYDTVDGIGVEKVEISIWRMSDYNYWSGTSWELKETWLKASGTNNWLFNSTLVIWTSGTEYRVRARATDNLGNIETPNYELRFYLDFDSPTSFIEIPKNNTYLNILESINGISEDTGGSGLAGVQICIQQKSDKKYWDGTRWSLQEYWLDTYGVSTWYYEAFDVQWVTDTEYIIYSSALDFVGNIEISGSGITFIFDTIPPNNSISINDDTEFTNSTSITLSLDSVDSGSGASSMVFSTNDIHWTNWEPFNITKSFILPEGDGEKKVFLKVNDRAGNIAEPVFDSIILDTTPPRDLSIIINNGASKTNSTEITLELNAIDDTSGLYQISLSTDGVNWSAWENYTNTKSFTLPLGDGVKTVYFKAKDLVSNIAEPKVAEILLNTSSLDIIPDDGTDDGDDKKSGQSQIFVFSSEVWIIIIIVIIFAFIVLGFLIRRKKRASQDLLITKATTIKPISASEVEIYQEEFQAPADLAQGQQQGIAPGFDTYQTQTQIQTQIENQASDITTISTPEPVILEKTTQIGQPLPPEQIPGASQVPRLPPSSEQNPVQNPEQP